MCRCLIATPRYGVGFARGHAKGHVDDRHRRPSSPGKAHADVQRMIFSAGGDLPVITQVGVVGDLGLRREADHRRVGCGCGTVDSPVRR
jgi:hypothetical protein